MSRDFWSINGYGINVSEDEIEKLFDIRKILKSYLEDTITLEMEIEIDSPDFDLWSKNMRTKDSFMYKHDIYWSNIVEHLIAGCSQLTYADTGDSTYDREYYIFLPTALPWQFSKEDLELDSIKVEDMFIKQLEPFLKDEIDTIQIREAINYIDTGGSSN